MLGRTDRGSGKGYWTTSSPAPQGLAGCGTAAAQGLRGDRLRTACQGLLPAAAQRNANEDLRNALQGEVLYVENNSVCLFLCFHALYNAQQTELNPSDPLNPSISLM